MQGFFFFFTVNRQFVYMGIRHFIQTFAGQRALLLTTLKAFPPLEDKALSQVSWIYFVSIKDRLNSQSCYCQGLNTQPNKVQLEPA